MTSETFQIFSMPRRSCTMTECRKAVAVNQQQAGEFIHRVPSPVTSHPNSWSAQSAPSVRPTVRKSHDIIVHRRTALSQPSSVRAGGQRRDAERERDGHADEAQIEQRRMNRHVVVLEQGVQASPVGVLRGEERREGVVVQRHRRQEEHIYGRDGRDRPGISGRYRSRFTMIATLPNAARSVTQNMTEPSRPPQ